MAKSIKQQYKAARRNLMARVRRIKAKGYTVPENLIPKIPKKPTAASIRRLKGLTSEAILRKSTYVAPDTGKASPAIYEEQKRRYIRAQQAGRARAEAYRQKQAARPQIVYEPVPEIEIEPESPEISEGELIYQRVLDDIASASADPDTEDAADYLSDLLNREIDHYGFDAVMRGIAQAPDEFLDACDTALRYGPGSSYNGAAIASLMTVIRGGVIPTAEELSNIYDMEDDLPLD